MRFSRCPSESSGSRLRFIDAYDVYSVVNNRGSFSFARGIAARICRTTAELATAHRPRESTLASAVHRYNASTCSEHYSARACVIDCIARQNWSTSDRQLENLVETISRTRAPSINPPLLEIEAISLSHFSKPRQQKPHVGSITKP